MFVRAGGIATHVRLDGPPGGEKLLLIHSLGTASPVWDAQVPALAAAGFRVIRYDLRGHGLTESAPGPYTMSGLAADAASVLDTLAVPRAHVAGISIGGMIAQTLATSAPERVASLLLLDTALAIGPAETWAERARAVRAAGTAAIADSVIDRWVTPAFRDHPTTLGLRAMLLRTDPEGYAGAAEAIGGTDLTATTRQLRVPAAVIVGAADPSTPVSSAETLAAAIPGATLTVIDGAAHIPLFEQSQAVTTAILGFLRRDADDWALSGKRTRQAVLSEAHVARAEAATTQIDAPFQDFITRAAWGGVWSRPGLDRRTRGLITLALLAGLGREEELKLHLSATQNTGASDAEVAEMLLHVAVYAGVPAANAAMRALKAAVAARARALQDEPT